MTKPVRSSQGSADGGEDFIDAAIDALISQRVQAKKSKDFKAADAIRDQLASQGIILEDVPGGTAWRRRIRRAV